MDTLTPLELKHTRSARRWATAFSIPSFLFILTCAAFAEQMARVIGIPALVVYGVAIASAILTLTMIVGVESSVSSGVYRALGIAYAVSAVILCALFVVFIVIDADGVYAVNEIGSIAVVVGFAAIAVLFLAVTVARRSRIA